MNSRTPPLSVGIGQRIAELRRAERVTVTADTVAEEAQAVGLKWTRTTVTFLETGRRAILADELLMLPFVMSRALRRDVTLAELLPNEARMSRSVAFTAKMFDKLLSGEPITYKAQPTLRPRAKASA